MPNTIKTIESIKKRIRLGYPEGVDTLSSKQIPQLLARIEELERALEPFARVAALNATFPTELVNVYLRDCDAALDKLDQSRSLPAEKIDNFFDIPAE
jgi:hypothetical protein